MKRIGWMLGLGVLLAVGAGCSDDDSTTTDDGGTDTPPTDDGTLPGDDGGADVPPTDDGTPPGDDGGTDVPPTDDGTPPTDDAGTEDATVTPCSTPLADRIRVTAVSVAPANVATSSGGYFTPDMPVILSPQADGSSRVGWNDGAGTTHATPLDANDNRRGADLTTDGGELRGFVALDDGAALLVRRDDVMAVVRLDDSGGTRFTTNTVGGTSHDVEGSRWIDDWSHDGRLAWNGSQFAAYHGQTGNHGSLGNHQGDRFDLLDPAGARSTNWDWGCSHSLDVRLAWNGTTFGPVCLSDCYPSKAILYNHYGMIHDEPSGNCAGGSDASLGGLAPVADGFWLDFTSREGRGSSDVGLVHITSDGTVGPVVFLMDTAAVDESKAHLARYGDDLLAAWDSGGTTTIAVVNGEGTALEGPLASSAQFGARDDFINWPNGDVGWAYAWGDTTQLQIVRIAHCE